MKRQPTYDRHDVVVRFSIYTLPDCTPTVDDVLACATNKILAEDYETDVYSETDDEEDGEMSLAASMGWPE